MPILTIHVHGIVLYVACCVCPLEHSVIMYSRFTHATAHVSASFLLTAKAWSIVQVFCLLLCAPVDGHLDYLYSLGMICLRTLYMQVFLYICF